LTGEGRRLASGGSCHGVVLDPHFPRATRPMGPNSAVWHDVECDSYAADLALWEELADGAGGGILDLGCGTGRVGLHLARRGHRVTGLDVDAALLAAFRERASGRPVEVELGDARGFELGREFGLALAPMQLVQLFAGAEERVECLRCIAGHLRPGGRAALAIVEEVQVAEAGGAPLPDVREFDGWIYSSLPIETVVRNGSIVVRRLRQVVSPAGDLSEELSDVGLRRLSAGMLEREAVEAGLMSVGRREIPASDAHVGSTVVLLERSA
jgi:SAM-dependent methyltransferase